MMKKEVFNGKNHFPNPATIKGAVSLNDAAAKMLDKFFPKRGLGLSQ